jgi:sigma-B regulation protein RsbU (phosphoserine phosphatase)
VSPALPSPDFRLSEADLLDHYEQAPCGYCSCRPDGTLVRLNRTLLDWLGHTHDELAGHRTAQQLLTVGGRLHYEMHVLPLLLLQDEVRGLSYLLRQKDGRSRPVLLQARLLRDDTHQPQAIRFTFFDITERYHYEQELRRSHALAQEKSEQLAQANALLTAQNEQLSRSTADLDNFVYMASHDLRQPINNMAGLFAELKRTAAFTDPDTEDMVRMFEASLQQAVRTIEGLTEVVEQQQVLIPVEAHALHPLAEEILASLQPQLLAQQAEFRLDFAAAPTVHTTRPGLYSTLYNLFSNALRYAEPGRPARVLVQSAREAGAVVLTVQDNGRGLDLAQHGTELFQLARRFHPEVAEGTGTGLYLVNRLMTQAGGRVEVESEVGRGTTFRLVWPQ